MVHVEIGSIIIQQIGNRYTVRFSKESSDVFEDFNTALKAAWSYFNASGVEL